MKDTMKPLRLAVFNALTGSLTYNSTAVDLFDEKVPIDEAANIYVLLATQTESPDETSETFITKSTIELQIIAKTSEVSKDVIDDISDQIYVILRPTPGTTGLANPTGFQFGYVGRESAASQTFQVTDTQSVIVKSIVITTTMIQTT